MSDESSGTIDFEDYSDDDNNVPSIFEPTGRNGRLKKRQDEHETQGSYLNFTRFVVKSIHIHVLRFLEFISCRTFRINYLKVKCYFRKLKLPSLIFIVTVM